uniref:Uncharacterized protein n=1 Tax=Periophthalmus magnuspinnatus TaxID=409849 RepID=A0A3B4BJ29_9GOBI
NRGPTSFHTGTSSKHSYTNVCRWCCNIHTYKEHTRSQSHPNISSYIHYAESSMKNGFGLKYLHRFFNIPFLQLQRETLLRQLETNQLDMDATLEELGVQQETEDQNYEIEETLWFRASRTSWTRMIQCPVCPSHGACPRLKISP